MKKILLSYLLFVCISCAPTKSDNQEPEKQTAIKYENLSKEHLGLWVYEDYITTLRQTMSTKKASDSGVDYFYSIKEPNSIMSLSIHEGGANNILLMTSKNEGQIFSPDSSEAYNTVVFENAFLIVDSKKFIKAPYGLDELVNEVILSGEYLIDNETIQISKNGSIKGLDNISFCKLNLDYIDAGMQYDKIYFQFKNEKEPRTFLYEFSSDTLIIREIDCLTQAEDYDYCLEVEKGPIIYKMIKK